MSAPGNIKRAETTKSDWRTPQYIFNYWDERYHFTLDAAASAENALCPVYRDLKWDSLTNGWGVKDESALNWKSGIALLLDCTGIEESLARRFYVDNDRR